MNAEQFCYWLQGRAELCREAPSAEEWKLIAEHLQLVFKKQTHPMQQFFEDNLRDKQKYTEDIRVRRPSIIC